MSSLPPLHRAIQRCIRLNARRRLTTSARRPSKHASPSSPPPSPPFPTVSTCPEPTCACAATPAMPEGLPIDHAGRLNGVISGYAEQVLICTGRDDWPSRIEDEHGGDNLAADLKELFGKGGVYSDPFHNVSVLNASFPSSPPPRRRRDLQTTSAYLVPSFKYVPFLPRVSFDSVDVLARGYLLPARLHAAHDGLSPVHRDRLTRQDAYRRLLFGVRDVADVLVLVCGHGGRDMRCGVMGPALRAEFARALAREGVVVLEGPVEADGPGDGGGMEEEAAAIPAPEGGAAQEAAEKETTGTEKGGAGISARIGLISHIGGHKFAGNVIVYLPPGMRTAAGEAHPLAGKGIWYGRVEPRHAEGIVRETVLGGRVIADMFRGGIDQDRRIFRS